MKWKSQGERNAGGGEKYAGRLWEPAWYLCVFLSWFLLYGAIQEGFPKKRSGRHRYPREPLTRQKKAAGDRENGRTYDRADTKAGGQNIADLYLSAGTEVVESGD